MPLSISDNLTNIVDVAKAEDGITIGQSAKMLGRNSIVLAILLFSLPSSLPTTGIPGFTIFTGIPIMFLGFQIMIGNERIWLPRRVSAYRLHNAKLLRVMEKAVGMLETMEKKMCKRMAVLSTTPWRNICGGMFVLCGFILASPIPFFNMPIGVVSSLLAIGLIERDGVIIALSMMASSLVCVACFLFVQEGWEIVAAWF